MRDVSRLAGVSTMTVSRVLTDPSLVAEETRQRVLQAVEQLRYVPDRVAGSLSSRRSGFVALILPTLMNSNFADTAQALSEGLHRAGYQLLIGYTLYRLDEEERVIQSVLTRRPEAIVLTGIEHSRKTTAMLFEAGVPVVEIWDLQDRPIDYVVGYSNFEVGRAAAHHLVGLGHRRVCAVGPCDSGEARDFRAEQRLAGFAAGLRETGMPDDLIFRHSHVPLSFTEGAEAMEMVAREAPDVEAIFAASDLHAVGVLMECQRRSIRVPDDLSIMGFGDFEIGRQCVPPLTTMRVDARAIGLRTAEVILGALGVQPPQESPPQEGSSSAPPARVHDLGFEVLTRGSTRPGNWKP